MKNKKKSSKKVWTVFICIFIIYVVFMTIMNSVSDKPGKNNESVAETENYANQEIELNHLEKYPFGGSLKSTLLAIGVDDATKAVCEIDNSSNTTLRITTDSKNLWVAINDRYSDVREVEWIKNYDGEQVYYYISDNLGYNEPVYSYKTDEILVDKVDGESSKYPFIVTADDLAKEINQDTEKAAAKYNGKWIQITGKVTSVSDGGSMYGYYLYGKRGDEGLKITCWIKSELPKAFSGDIKTFLGKMREVTVVNNTEIVDCEIIE